MSMCITFPIGRRGAFLATRNMARTIRADLRGADPASDLASEVPSSTSVASMR